MNAYHPTLWRTCRVLANPQRLACLKEVLLTPDATVEEIAASAAIPHNKASMGLRALQARGLLSVRRQSRWVHYLPEPDLLVPSATPVLAALRHALVTAPLKETEIITALTAFTHPRRLSILQRLSQGRAPQIAEVLVAVTHISPPALWRHLMNLEARGLASRTDDGWMLSPKPSRLARALLALLDDTAP